MNESTQPQYGESWQDIVSGPPAPETPATEQPATSGRTRGVARAAGLGVAGLLAGIIGVTAMQAASGGTPSPATDTTTAQGALQGQGAPAGGPGFNGRPPGGGGSGFAGEQRLMGTLTAIGTASVTVQTDDGTSTYAVTGATDIERNGEPVALSALKVGDAVLVHVLPSGSGYVAERVLAGASGGPAVAPPPPTTGRTT
jgi:hypothetical protein